MDGGYSVITTELVALIGLGITTMGGFTLLAIRLGSLNTKVNTLWDIFLAGVLDAQKRAHIVRRGSGWRPTNQGIIIQHKLFKDYWVKDKKGRDKLIQLVKNFGVDSFVEKAETLDIDFYAVVALSIVDEE